MKIKFYRSLQVQLIAALIVGTTIMGGVVVTLISKSISDQIAQKQISTQKIINQLFENELMQKKQTLDFALHEILMNNDVVTLFAKRDRNGLKNLLLYDYQNNIKEKYGIAQFQFHLPDATSFLRLHKPNKFGDNLSKFRKTVVEVARTKMPVSGLEVGEAGLGLRLVYPVFYNSKYIGSVEFGGSFVSILHNIQSVSKVSFAVGIKENVFADAGHKVKAGDIKSGGLDFYLFSNSIMKNVISSNYTDKSKTINIDENYYYIFSFPIKDYSNKTIGKAFFLIDETDVYNDFYNKKNTIIGVIIGFVIFFMALFIIVFRNRIIKPINRSVDFTSKIAAGDYNSEIKHKAKDEISILINNLIGMRNKIKENFETALKNSEEAEKAAQIAEHEKQKVEETQNYLSQSTHEMLDAMEKFSAGDLTVKLVPKNPDDEIGKLFQGFNIAVSKIKELIIKVIEIVEATASAGTQISSSAEEMAAGANEQSSHSNEVAGAVEEVTQTIMGTTQNAQNAAELSKEAEKYSIEGGTKIKEAKEGMEKIVVAANETGSSIESLTRKTEQIGEITKVIDEIADQTNLLALNAAIEAARAGEQGRGFAVVADEVRKLAERTLKATKEIGDMIAEIQAESHNANKSMQNAEKAVKEGADKTEEVEQALKMIMTESEKVEKEIETLASASEEELKAIEDIASSMAVMNNVTQETSAGIQQIAQATEDLARLTETLKNVVATFRIDYDAHSGQNTLSDSGTNYLE